MLSEKQVIGQKIAQARVEAGLTQKQLAESTGFTERAVQAWEGDTRHPRPGPLFKLAEATGKTVAWFYTDNGQGPS